MFFWGSYNFQVPQLTEHPNRQPLRYPIYMPPTPSMINDGNSVRSEWCSEEKEKEEEEEKILRCMDTRRILVKYLACGQKHLVALMRVITHIDNTTKEVNDNDNMKWVIYGMGSNHNGQLGHRIPEYTTTLTKLHFEDLLSFGTTVNSIACGNKHTLISTTNGSVFAAGDNSFDQLGVNVKISGFAPVGSLAHIKTVYAAGNVSFALSHKGHLYSWGEAQYGHLCHGDNGERLDPHSLQPVKTNVKVPTLVQWFVRHHVVLVEVAVARAHVVCRTTDDVYTCGEGVYGKLGSGSIASSFIPHRVYFPERSHPERLCGIAAGDDHTLVLRESSVVGAVVYFFGKMSNNDGQFVPIIVSAPANIVRIGAGRGTVCTALTSDGLLYVWGKHGYNKVTNGTSADSKRVNPQLVMTLEPFVITDVVVGGTFVVALAASCRSAITESSTQMKESNDRNKGVENSSAHRWDVVVPHDARVSRYVVKGTTDTYEESVKAFLAQYLGPTLYPKYITKMPEAPPLTDHFANAFIPIGANAITIGQKVRLWMTDVYALGTIIAVLPTNDAKSTMETKKSENNGIQQNGSANGSFHPILLDNEGAEEDTNIELKPKEGCRFRIEWQRDDWHEEEITLYSEDETLNDENPNRWQPLWFLQDPQNNGEYLLDK